jgi:N-methylhydantoinase A
LTRCCHSNPSAPIEYVNLRVAALGAVQKFANPTENAKSVNGAAVQVRRNAVFDGVAHVTPVIRRDHMGAGYESSGPLIIEEQSATTVVPPQWQVQVDEQGNILLRRART